MRALPVVVVAFAAVVVAAPLARAHVETGNPISTAMKFGFERTKKMLLASADLMPAADYAFKPTPEVRSYGEVIGHVADSNYMFCSAFKGTPAPKKDIEKTVTTKDGLKKALAEALAYCDSVYSTANDAQLSQPLEMFGQKMVKFSALDINLAHDMEHYGTISTYLRLKKLTPPSSMKEKEKEK